MKKLIRLALPLFAVAMLSVAFLSSCGSPKGKMYKNTADYQKTMEFLGDSTVIIKGAGVSTLGYYRVTGNVVIVNLGATNLVYRILDSTTLIEETTAVRWKKI